MPPHPQAFLHFLLLKRNKPLSGPLADFLLCDQLLFLILHICLLSRGAYVHIATRDDIEVINIEL